MTLDFSKTEFLRAASCKDHFLRGDLPQIAFAGRSNVGKSSVINRLTGRVKLAYVGSTPGKTAQINYFGVSGKAYLVDLPGYGYAKVSDADRKRWNHLIDRYFAQAERCSLLFQLLDCRHDPSADDVQMMEYLRYHGIPFLVALTKGDKLKKSEMLPCREHFAALCAEYGCKDVLLTSAENGLGIEELRGWLERAATEHDDGV